MKVFVTGATGFIGSAVVDELLAHGHEVVGLARSDESAAKLKSKGAQVVKGDIKDVDVIKKAASAADGVAHLAFNHDFSTYVQNCQDDADIINAMGEALEGSGKPFVVTSGALAYDMASSNNVFDEDSALSNVPRTMSDKAALALMNKGLKPMIMRLAPTVHGLGDKGFVPIFSAIFKNAGVVMYKVGATWPAVHRLDAAVLYRLMLENPRAGFGANGVAEPAVLLKDVFAIVARRLNLPLKEVSVEELNKLAPPMGSFVSHSAVVNSYKTQSAFGWIPTRLNLIEDITNPEYKLIKQ